MSREFLTWKGRCGPLEIGLGAATFRPSTISILIADAMEVVEGYKVVDLGCGSGILSIVAAKLGAGRVYGVDAADETVEVASANATANAVGDRTRFYQGDLSDPLPPNLRADVVIGDVSGIPDELAEVSGWFPSRLSGGPSGAELPMRMLDEAGELLRRGGKLLLPTGTLQDENSILAKAQSKFGSIRRLVERVIPLPQTLAEHPVVVDLIRHKVVKLTRRGSRSLWTARIWELIA